MKKLAAIFLVMSAWIVISASEIELKQGTLLTNYKGLVSVDKASINTETGKVSLYITMSEKWLETLDDFSLEMFNRHYLALMVKSKLNFSGMIFYVRKEGLSEYKSILSYLKKLPAVPVKEGESVPQTKSLIPEKKYGNISGGLSGKTVFVSPGHGWVYDSDTSSWTTQRGITQGMREDDSNTEIVSYFLVPYLQNAGALVFSARETDRNENMIIVDDADGNLFSENGVYEESGAWAETTSGQGYGRTSYPIEINVNPLSSGKYRYATAGTGAWARWTPVFPEDGSYHVYVTYKTYTDRAPDAVYTVNYAGGSVDVTVDQRHHGSTWVDLGSFYFKKGSSVESGSVALNKNDDAGNGSIIIADAVRFGGGDGILTRGGSVSGKPRWEEAAKVHAQFIGAPDTVYQSSTNDRTADVTARSRWAAWENEAGTDDSVYISWHSNAYDGSSRGISTYIYSSDDPGSAYVTSEAQEGSVELAELVHNRILDSVKTLFDSSWYEYGSGLYSAYFGELNPSYNNEMPSCLVELAFHDNSSDSMMLRNPKFRDIATRAAYQAIVKYFAERDGYDPVYLPGSPINLRTQVSQNGSVTLFWDEPETDENFYLGHPATGYIVQKSSDGHSFDTGTDLGNVFQYTEDISDESGPIYFRVLAYNDGGVSFPSVTAGTVYSGRKSQILVVDGFERMDANTPRFNLGSSGNNRYTLEFINSYNYFIEYAKILDSLDFSVDYAQKGAVGSIDLTHYDAVIWYSGEQSSADTTFTVEEQSVVAQFIQNGGAFFLSGSEIGWDLVEKGTTEDKAFFNEVLNTDYVEDSSDLYTLTGTGDFAAIEGVFDDGTYFYQANYPDVIQPFTVNGSQILYYDSAETLGAGVLTVSGGKTAVLGFPFETIIDFGTKAAIMEKILEKFEIEPEEISDETPDSEIPDEISDEIPDEVPDHVPDEISDEFSDETTDSTVTDETMYEDQDITENTDENSESADEEANHDIENQDNDSTEKPGNGGKGCSAVFM